MTEPVRELYGVARDPVDNTRCSEWRVEVLTLKTAGCTRYAAQATHLVTGATCGWAPEDIEDRATGQKHRARAHACRLFHMIERTPVGHLPLREEMYP